MTTRTKQLEAGTIAYDLAQKEPVIVVDPDVGTIAEQDNALEEMIRGSPGNQACGFDPDTQCVSVTFANLDGTNDTTYTYPETRIGVPRVSLLEERLTPREFVQYQTLSDLLAEAMRLDRSGDVADAVASIKMAWSAAGLSGDVLDAVEESLDQNLDNYADD